MSEQVFSSEPKSISHHLQELYSLVKTSIVLIGIFSLLWSIFTPQILTYWIGMFNLDSEAGNLSIYAPFNWLEIKWSSSIILGILTAVPIFSYMLLRFASPGLYQSEYNWLRFALMANSVLLPLTTIMIWFWAIPEIISLLGSVSELENVRTSYDAAEIINLALGSTWIAILSIVLITSLSMARSISTSEDQYYWTRTRLVLIFSGLIILTIPDTFDGLRIAISILLAYICIKISRLLPVAKNESNDIQDVTAFKGRTL